MITESYRQQVDLLLRMIPFAAEEESFALKGGTAINMFVWDMPRLSVDLDLVYLPFDERDLALERIAQSLLRIKEKAQKFIPGIKIMTQNQEGGEETKLLCRVSRAQIKIEVNTVMRGHIMPVRLMLLAETTQQEFQKFAAMQILSHGELFGGKICAALDRQHPRDLFDIYLLLGKEDLTEDIKKGFLACLLGHPRPLNEVLEARLKDQRETFESQFQGMTDEPFTYEDYLATRDQLKRLIHAMLNENDKDFLLSFKRGEPAWDLINIDYLQDLPAVKWKLLNIRRLKKENSPKHALMLKELENKLFTYDK